MFDDTKVIDFLGSRSPESFSGTVFRATRLGLDATEPSQAGGRWMPRNAMAVLYTSLERDGALAEISFRLGMQSPVPTKPIALHQLRLRTKKTIRIAREDFSTLGIDPNRYIELDYFRTQAIGKLISSMEYDGIRVPSARWSCDNLVLLSDHHDALDAPEVISTEEVAWLDWARSKGFVLSV